MFQESADLNRHSVLSAKLNPGTGSHRQSSGAYLWGGNWTPKITCGNWYRLCGAALKSDTSSWGNLQGLQRRLFHLILWWSSINVSEPTLGVVGYDAFPTEANEEDVCCAVPYSTSTELHVPKHLYLKQHCKGQPAELLYVAPILLNQTARFTMSFSLMMRGHPTARCLLLVSPLFILFAENSTTRKTYQSCCFANTHSESSGYFNLPTLKFA
ncbi:hypothetical protein TNCV_534171 [Trichonephila clavipes]|nr:hypothetical protein TNCV_534171 [Trichonephila clavipes]